MKPWFRFGLRTLLVTLTILCVALGVWVQRARSQQSAVRAIWRLGGSVTYSTPWIGALERWPGIDYCASVVEVDLYRYEMYPPEAMHASRIEVLTDIDQAIPHLQRLPALRQIKAWDSHPASSLEQLGRALPHVLLEAPKTP